MLQKISLSVIFLTENAFSVAGTITDATFPSSTENSPVDFDSRLFAKKKLLQKQQILLQTLFFIRHIYHLHAL